MDRIGGSAAGRMAIGTFVVALVATGVAFAADSGSVRIEGPTTVKLGERFNETISGHISTLHRAYSTEMFEQTPAGPPCAAKFDDEHRRAYAHSQGGEFVMHNPFHEVFHYRARVPGTHRFCAYVSRYVTESLNTSHTIARASLSVSYRS